MNNSPVLSICIPTFERPQSLYNCLNSILIAKGFSDFPFEVCVSDNSSSDESESIVNLFAEYFDIYYHRNLSNLGFAGNFVQVTQMAQGEFIWLVGDDDLIMPDSLLTFSDIYSENNDVDFFCVNAFQISYLQLLSYPSPFDTRFLPNDMSKFSKYAKSHRLPFKDLIDHRKSFDFLGGIFLSIFRRKDWLENIDCLDYNFSDNLIHFRNLDTTFPHSKIFANTFMGKNAYFCSKPLSVAVSGLRSWSEYYPLIRTFRLLDLLDEYRKNGLSKVQYFRNKNATPIEQKKATKLESKYYIIFFLSLSTFLLLFR
jgi:glycosyltransferase involved in cell wall biosynthesis